MCFTESSLNYETKHQGLYDGVCGVDPDIWNDYLADKGVHYNSLQGGLLVYKYYLKKTNNKRVGRERLFLGNFTRCKKHIHN